MPANSFDAKATLEVGGRSHDIFRLDALQPKYDVARLPFSLKVLLENLLRNEDGKNVTPAAIEALAKYDPKNVGETEIAYTPARVLLRTSPACPAWSISPRCAKASPRWAATRRRSTRSSPSISSSITRCRSTRSATCAPSTRT